jgi:hypothetical protein
MRPLAGLFYALALLIPDYSIRSDSAESPITGLLTLIPING